MIFQQREILPNTNPNFISSSDKIHSDTQSNVIT